MFLSRTESEDICVACVWWASVVPQFNDTPGLVLCLEVKAARRAPPHGLRPYNHGGAFFRAERDGVWVTYERPNEQSPETTWSKKKKGERDRKQALWHGSGTDSSHVFWRNYTLVPDFSGTRENILSCQKMEERTATLSGRITSGPGRLHISLWKSHFSQMTHTAKALPTLEKTLTWRVLPHPRESQKVFWFTSCLSAPQLVLVCFASLLHKYIHCSVFLLAKKLKKKKKIAVVLP